MNPSDDLYIWVNRWDEFQTFQNKKGKPWAPPWIKTYVAQLSDDRYLELTDRQRALLHDLRMVFAMTRGRLRCDHLTIGRYRHVRTRYDDLVALNHAGFITFCSGTVLETFRNQFWNRSTLEVDVEEKKINPPTPNPVVDVDDDEGDDRDLRAAIAEETRQRILAGEGVLKDIPF